MVYVHKRGFGWGYDPRKPLERRFKEEPVNIIRPPSDVAESGIDGSAERRESPAMPTVLKSQARSAWGSEPLEAEVLVEL